MFASLHTALPDIVNFINATNVISGTETELPCYADGEPLQSVTWEFSFIGDLERRQFILQYIVNDTGYAIGTNFTSLVAGVNEENMFSIAEPNRTTQDYGMLTIRNISVFQAGQYRCTLSNVHGNESRTAVVGVQCK